MTALWWDRIEVFLQLSYIAFYATLGIQGLWEAYFSGGIRQVGQALRNQGTTPVVFALALAAFPAALTGMFLFAADIQPAILDGVWKGVFGFLVLVFVVERRQHYRQFLRKPDPRLPEEDVEHAACLLHPRNLSYRVALPLDELSSCVPHLSCPGSRRTSSCN